MSPENPKYRVGFDEVISKAKETVLRDGYHDPILVIEGTRNLLVSQIEDMPETHVERIELLRYIGQAAAKSEMVGQLRQVLLISEGWMSLASEGKVPEMRPSQYPNRKEVLIVSSLHIEERKKCLRVFEMLRDGNEKVFKLEELSPNVEKDEQIEIPLLDAFAQGFQMGFRRRIN